MRFINADYIRLHHRDRLEQLLQQFVPNPLPLLRPPLPFFPLILPFCHHGQMFVHYPAQSCGHLRQIFQVCYSVFHLGFCRWASAVN